MNKRQWIGGVNLFISVAKGLESNLAELFIHRKAVEVHVAGNVEVDSGGVPDGGVAVHAEGGGLDVVGRHPELLRLVNEQVRHPEPGYKYVLRNYLFSFD